MSNRATAAWPPVQRRVGRSAGLRRLLAGIVVAVAAYLVLEAAVRPLLAARTEALASIARSELARSRLADPPRPGVRQGGGAADAPVSAVVTRTAGARGLTIRRIEPAGAGAQVLIENAGFNEIVEWIAELEIEQGLRVVALGMDRTTDPGIVNASLTVRR